MRLALLFVVVNMCSSYLINTRLHFMKTKTCFPDDNISRKKYRNNIVHAMENPLYTLIWYDCPKCKELVLEMEKLHLKYVYINGDIYFNDILDVTNEFINPILYKEDVLIGENLYDIYEEIYKAGDY